MLRAQNDQTANNPFLIPQTKKRWAGGMHCLNIRENMSMILGLAGILKEDKQALTIRESGYFPTIK